MKLSEEVKQLLLQGNEERLADLAAADPRAVRPLIGRLWDPDLEIRRRAARAVGRTAAANNDLGVEVIRRLMWALNDESATNGIHAIPALGEIGRQAPDMLAPYVPALVSMSADEGIRIELLAALTAVAESAPELIAGHLQRLETAIDRSRREDWRAFSRLVAAVKKRNGDDD